MKISKMEKCLKNNIAKTLHGCYSYMEVRTGEICLHFLLQVLDV